MSACEDQYQGRGLQRGMSLHSALWGRVIYPIPPAHHQPRGLPCPLPTEDPQFDLGSHPQQH